MLLLPSDLIRDPNITDQELFVYVFTKIHTYSTNYESCMFNIMEVVDQAYGKNRSHSVYDRFTTAFKGLISKGYLKVQKINKQAWYIFMETYEICEEDIFFKVEPEDLRHIVDSIKKNRSTIMRYYLLLLSTINSRTKVGTHERAWFAEMLNVAPNTISGYTQQLEKLQLISVYRSTDFTTSNTYGLYADADKVRAEGARRSKGRELSSASNIKRRYVQMYQNAVNGFSYDRDQLQDIYEHMKQRNDELAKLGNKARGEIYDLSPLIAKINAM